MTHDMTDTELETAYRALLRKRPGARNDRVDPERMLAVIEGRGAETERVAALNAIMADAESAREFEVLRSLAAAAAPRKIPMWRRPMLLAPLAAAALVLVVAIPMLQREWLAPEPMRDVSDVPLLIAPPVEASAALARTFRWHGVTGARFYVVEILAATGRPVFTTRTTETSFTLPEDVVLARRVEYRWWVTGELADGTQRRSAFRRLVLQKE